MKLLIAACWMRCRRLGDVLPLMSHIGFRHITTNDSHFVIIAALCCTGCWSKVCNVKVATVVSLHFQSLQLLSFFLGFMMHSFWFIIIYLFIISINCNFYFYWASMFIAFYICIPQFWKGMAEYLIRLWVMTRSTWLAWFVPNQPSFIYFQCILIFALIAVNMS